MTRDCHIPRHRRGYVHLDGLTPEAMEAFLATPRTQLVEILWIDAGMAHRVLVPRHQMMLDPDSQSVTVCFDKLDLETGPRYH